MYMQYHCMNVLFNLLARSVLFKTKTLKLIGLSLYIFETSLRVFLRIELIDGKLLSFGKM